MDANITDGFIAMVEAYKAKPELEAKIESLKQDVDFFERNLRIEEDTSRSLRDQLATREAELAEVRKARDDAMFRNLELEELKDKVGGLVGQALAMFRPATPVAEPAGAESARSVTQVEHVVSTPGTASEEGASIVAGSGQSDVNPTASPTETVIDTTISKDGTEPTQTVSNPIYPSLSPSEPDGWERGKPYSYKPWYMTDTEWVSRGGFGPDLAPPMADPFAF